MKKLMAAWFLLVLLCGAVLAAEGELPHVAPGSQAPLALPADKILRISPTLVEFEHHWVFCPSARMCSAISTGRQRWCPYLDAVGGL